MIAGNWLNTGLLMAAIMAFVDLIFAPIAAMLLQMAISRTREFDADGGGADMSLRGLFATHPSTAERIARLHAMAR